MWVKGKQTRLSLQNASNAKPGGLKALLAGDRVRVFGGQVGGLGSILTSITQTTQTLQGVRDRLQEVEERLGRQKTCPLCTQKL